MVFLTLTTGSYHRPLAHVKTIPMSDSAKKINAILGRSSILTAIELQAEENATTSDDYDTWVLDAVHARLNGKIDLDAHGTTVEHPTTRLFRIGIESIKAGKASALFLLLLEEIANRAETHDVLCMVFPNEFTRKVTRAQMNAADNQQWIASEYQKFIAKHHVKKACTLDVMKEMFKKTMEVQGISAKTVDRALEQSGLNWHATPGPKPNPKHKKESR